MSVTEHELTLESGFLEDGSTPRCDCGWSGEFVVSVEEGVEQWENHCEGLVAGHGARGDPAPAERRHRP